MGHSLVPSESQTPTRTLTRTSGREGRASGTETGQSRVRPYLSSLPSPVRATLSHPTPSSPEVDGSAFSSTPELYKLSLVFSLLVGTGETYTDSFSCTGNPRTLDKLSSVECLSPGLQEGCGTVRRLPGWGWRVTGVRSGRSGKTTEESRGFRRWVTNGTGQVQDEDRK